MSMVVAGVAKKAAKSAAAKKAAPAPGKTATGGRSSLPPHVANDPEVKRRQAAAQAAGAAPAEAPAAEGGRSFSMPGLPRGGGVETGSGIILGVILWAITANWIRGGPAQAKGWVVAKLTNRPYGGGVSRDLAPPTPQGPDGGLPFGAGRAEV